jgi:ATP-dependent Clp protease ATP-binding subunit ClpC
MVIAVTRCGEDAMEPRFGPFTDRARHVLAHAWEEARFLDDGCVGTEHLLLGLLHDEQTIAAEVLARLDVSRHTVRQVAMQLGNHQRTSAAESSSTFTPRARSALELCFVEALQLGHIRVAPEHILLGLVSEREGVAARVLARLGAELSDVRHGVLQLVAWSPRRASGGSRTLALGMPWEQLMVCARCGRRPPVAGRLVAGGSALVCETCLRQRRAHFEGAVE